MVLNGLLFSMADKVVVFDEEVKGWTSFHSYKPDFMVGMNNRFFSFKNGDIYEHDSTLVPRCQFYGEDYPTKISTMVNVNPSDIKEMLALNIEGNTPWNVIIDSYVSSLESPISSTIQDVEFILKEGIWYAHTRRNEGMHFDSKSTYGIGVVTDITGNQVTFNGGNISLTVGDQILNGTLDIIGVISDILPGNVLVMTTVTGLVVGDFLVGMKNARVEGGGLRGYTFRVDMEVELGSKVEMFAVNAEIIRSYS